jgi:arylformamidase
MRYYDVSMSIHKDMQVYKNKTEKKPIITYSVNENPHFVSETSISMNLHTGTHLDFPRHMLKDGLQSTNFDPMTFHRLVKVFDLTHVQSVIEKEDLIALDIQVSDMIFLKTRNSLIDTFDFEFVYVSSAAASYLSQIGIFALGIDALGIERNNPMHQTHQILMNQNIWIIEGLRLKEVSQKIYHCIALPINIVESDALPLRVILHD